MKQESWNPLLCSYPDSDKVNALSFEAETLFTRLIARSDDNANYDGEPALILCGLYAKRFSDGLMDVTKALRLRDELVAAGLIELYKVNGKTYIHIADCKKCTRKDVHRDERFPQVPATKEVAEHDTHPLRSRTKNETPDHTRPYHNRTDKTIPWSGFGKDFSKTDGLVLAVGGDELDQAREVLRICKVSQRESAKLLATCDAKIIVKAFNEIKGSHTAVKNLAGYLVGTIRRLCGKGKAAR